MKSCFEVMLDESTFDDVENNSTHRLSEFIGSIAFISISLSTADFGNLQKEIIQLEKSSNKRVVISQWKARIFIL